MATVTRTCPYCGVPHALGSATGLVLQWVDGIPVKLSIAQFIDITPVKSHYDLVVCEKCHGLYDIALVKSPAQVTPQVQPPAPSSQSTGGGLTIASSTPNSASIKTIKVSCPVCWTIHTIPTAVGTILVSMHREKLHLSCCGELTKGMTRELKNRIQKELDRG